MFWVEIIKDYQKFCICEGAWSYFRILNIENTDELLKVYATPEDGKKCLILCLRKGELYPSKLNFNFIFKPTQHVKFEVHGGEITVVGESFDGAKRYKGSNQFLRSCPFNDIDDVIRNERAHKKLFQDKFEWIEESLLQRLGKTKFDDLKENQKIFFEKFKNTLIETKNDIEFDQAFLELMRYNNTEEMLEEDKQFLQKLKTEKKNRDGQDVSY